MLNQRIVVATCSPKYRVCVRVKSLLVSFTNHNYLLQGKESMRNDLMHRIVDTVQNHFVTRMCPVGQVRQCSYQSSEKTIFFSFLTKPLRVVVRRKRFPAVVCSAIRLALAASVLQAARAAISSSNALM